MIEALGVGREHIVGNSTIGLGNLGIAETAIVGHKVTTRVGIRMLHLTLAEVLVL